jgi:hypothetical protein
MVLWRLFFPLQREDELFLLRLAWQHFENGKSSYQQAHHNQS